MVVSGGVQGRRGGESLSSLLERSQRSGSGRVAGQARAIESMGGQAHARLQAVSSSMGPGCSKISLSPSAAIDVCRWE